MTMPVAVLSKRTLRGLLFDLKRLRVRLLNHRTVLQPDARMLHLGCGRRRVQGWLNVDITGSDYNMDIGGGSLPLPTGWFEIVVAQQVIEHLEIENQLEPLLKEIARVCIPGAQVWLSCPDMSRISRMYLEQGGEALLADRRARWPGFDLRGLPASHMMNILFHQGGEHVNLFDLSLLESLLRRNGFAECVRVEEADFLARFPEFPARGDDAVSLFVRATVGERGDTDASPT